MSAGGHQLPPVTFRPAAPNDAHAIAHVEHVSFVHAGERFGSRRIRYLIGSPRALVTVAAVDGRVLGWVAGLIGPARPERWGRIYAVAVDPESRGRKLGHRLLSQTVTALRERGAGRIFLEVRDDNHVAIKLYQRIGFVPCKTLPNYYAHDVHAIRMSLDPASAI